MRIVHEAPPVVVLVPSVLTSYSGSAAEIALQAATVREALAALERLHPALYASVCDETGAVRKHVNLFVNEDHVRELAGLDSLFRPGDELSILPAVSGG